MELKDKDKTLEGLRIAIQMEVDGKEYYLEASKKSKNETGKQLLKILSSEEDLHRVKFEEIYEAIIKDKDWSTISFQPGSSERLKTILTTAKNELVTNGMNTDTELGAVQTAMDMENKTYDFYKKRGSLATFAGEKEFYEEIAAQEKEHHRVLLDYFEFLKNPAAWFVQKEHQSLDGG